MNLKYFPKMHYNATSTFVVINSTDIRLESLWVNNNNNNIKRVWTESKHISGFALHNFQHIFTFTDKFSSLILGTSHPRKGSDLT